MASIQPRVDPATLPEPTGSFEWVQAPWGWALQCLPLRALASHAFTTRDFAMATGQHADPGGWDRIAQYMGMAPSQVWRLQQVHGCATLRVQQLDMDAGAPLPRADALVTTRSDVALAVKTADCVPILLADRRHRAIAAVHAGWRGTLQRIAAEAVARLLAATQGTAVDVVAAIGPSIGPDRYEVGPEVRGAFRQHGHTDAALGRWFSIGPTGRDHLDLWQANRDQLVDAGLRPDDVHLAGLCTATHARHFHSYRIDGQRAGRMLAVIRRR
jgi:YfiH family protein